MSERFDRWCMVLGGQVHGAYTDRKQAEERAKIIGADVIRLVEIREGEEILDLGAIPPTATEAVMRGAALDYGTRLQAAIERAEKAEVRLCASDAEVSVLRQLLKQFEDGGMSGREVREAKADERARFERETAARLLASVRYTSGVMWSMNVDEAVQESRKLADACFGAKEA